MNKLILVFPIVLLAFIVLVLTEWFICRGREEPCGGKDAGRRPDRSDALVMAVITLLYSVTAFTNLGNTASPESFCRFDARGEYAAVELKNGQSLGKLMYFSGLHTGSYYLQFSSDGETWTDAAALEQKYTDILKWHSLELGDAAIGAGQFRLISDGPLWLGELALFDTDGQRISPEELSFPEGCAPLFDEQDTVPEHSSFMDSAYFDEIYHARTAFEHLEAVKPYEISHPPLGKLIIGLGIQLFGLSPFGWRFMGTLTGCLMLPVLYIFVKRMFGGRAVPAAVTLLMATDFMHFTQTRIATIDSYAVFFILLMYLFMYIYLESDRSGRAWMLPLALSGLCFGLGAASKWTCIYAGAGLGLIWLIDRVERFIAVRAQASGMKKTADKAGLYRKYRAETGGNVLFCLGFFVAVPLLIYYLSYYPYGRAEGMSGPGMFFSRDYLDIVVDNQKYMFSYHSGVDATHPYSSRWWQWLLDARPILYYLDYFGGGASKSSIGAFVNPLLCWGGLGAMLAMVYLWIGERDRKARFIVIGYLAQLLPWVFVGRITFAYHYFPSTVFLLLALGHVFDRLCRRSKSRAALPIVFAGISLMLFVAFFPVLGGAEVSAAFADKYLGWFESWPF